MDRRAKGNDPTGGLGISDCDKCKAETPRLQRQSLGCGYEPKNDRVALALWAPPDGAAGYNGPEPTVCAGYSSSLPEVIEAAIARRAASLGFPIANPTEEMLQSILIVDGAFGDLKHWATTPAKEGGGQE